MRIALAILLLVGCKQAVQGTGSDCAVVAQRTLASLQPQIDASGSDAKVVLVKIIPVLETSCVEDKWPATLTSCIVAAKPGDAAALEQCQSLMPKAVQDKLQKRILAVTSPAK